MLRSPSIDVLRICVVAMIVFRHTFGSNDSLVSSVGVPFFFFITGWLWRRGKRTIYEELRHRWKTLGIPYISWLVLLYPPYLGGFYIQDELTVQKVTAPILGGSYVGAAYTTFWFISALFAVAVIFRMLDGVSKPSLGLLGILLLYAGSIWGEQLATVPLGLGVAIPSVAFAIFGYLLRGLTRSGMGSFLGVTLLPIAVASTFFFARINIKYGEFGTPIVSGVLAVIIIWGTLTLLDLLFRRVPKVSEILSQSLGPATTVAIVVVITHPLVLSVFAYMIPEPDLIVFLVALVVPWIVAIGLRHTALAPLLIGQSRPKTAVSSLPA